MRKLILLSAVAAIAIPSAASAQRHDYQRDQYSRHHHNRVAYRAPYAGWNYRPVTVGYQLRSAFFSPRYYVSNYNTYGLRAPGRNRQWIRYGDDLVLVNIRTGRVLQVMHNRY